MPAAPADSALYRDLLGDAGTAAFFTDAAELRAMLRVEGALALVQGRLGLIPEGAAAALHRAAADLQIDPAALAAGTAANGVPVPGLVEALRAAVAPPEHAGYAHWGATSQDIVDTGLALRLGEVLDLWEARLDALLGAFAGLADRHADLPMAARSYGQVATPTSFGAVVAAWGRPVLRHRARLAAVREAVLAVSLGGASGTLAAMGPRGPEVRAALAGELGLRDPGHGWHAERDGLAAFAGWMAGLAASLGKLGEDLILLAQSGIAEVAVAGAGASSTMPQKRNPVGPSVLVALARQVAGLAAVMQGAALHRQQRDGAAWFGEWLVLPQLCISTGRALALALDLAGRIAPDPAAMARGLDDGLGLVHAEALTFALTDRMPRPEAQAAVARLCREAVAQSVPLLALAERAFPGGDWRARLPGPGALGEAPATARAFARAVRTGR